MKIVFIADFFVEQILGGGELNNEELILMLRADGYEVFKYNSHQVTASLIEQHKEDSFIIANFCNIRPELISLFYNKNYVIYEHDHKYLRTRNPGVFKDFKAPFEQIVNLPFYQNANAVLCQSGFHAEIIKLNTGLNNLINLSGNIWSLDSLKFMREQCEIEKTNTCAIMSSNIEHKNTADAIRYCNAKDLTYNLISSPNYKEFLTLLGSNKTFVFFPKTPETLSRVVVEARMMNMGVIVNKMIGATREPWYSLKGIALIDKIINMRQDIKKTVIKSFG
jgi:hypothetical protein